MMQVVEAMNRPSLPSAEVEMIRAQIDNGELILSEKQGRSNVWQVYAKISHRNGDEVQNYVSCRDCQKLLRYNNKSTSNLVKHKCYLIKMELVNGSKLEVDEATKTQITNVATKWIIKNCRPYSVVADDGLRELLEQFMLIGAKHGIHFDVEKSLPHPTTISRNIGDIYELCFKNVKDEINTIKDNGFGLTSDTWTDDYNKTSYIALTMHFLVSGVLTVRLLGLRSMEDEGCTSENIFMKSKKLLMDFGCEFTQKSVIVTDRGANMAKAFQNTQHITCISYLLNNAVQKSVEEVIEIAELSNCCTKLINFLTKSELNTNLSTSLKSNWQTRWNSVFYMLSSVEKNWEEINAVLSSKNELRRIAAIDIICLKAVVKTLQPFEEALKYLEGGDYATLHLVLIYIHQLKNECQTIDGELDTVKRLKQRLEFYLITLVTENTTVFHKIALFLFPPANKLLLFSENEKKLVEQECIRLLKGIQNDVVIKQEVHRTSPMSKHKKLFLDFVESERNCNPDEIINQEVQMYKVVRVDNGVDFNVYNWWEMNKNNLPNLYKLSCTILATPASSASSDKVFSAAKNLLCERRSTLGSNELAINKIMFVHFNKGKNELDIEF